jgi:hypothetical protein
MSDDTHGAGYVVPTYREADDAPWYHFLHGNVPGHQIDFMYRAEVPQGPLMRQHFSHLARLMKYIEPQAGAPYAFAIGNLSRDDTQHEPGHGGVALMFGLRIQGITDHAGRQDPPFAHAVAAIDRQLDRSELLAAAGVFHRHVLAVAQSAEWYRSYVRCAAEAPEGMTAVLADYVAGFNDLPSPPPSSMGLKWTVGESTPPSRIVIVHDDDAPFGMIAECAAKIAAVLFPSDIRWSAISNGREADLPNGVTVRLVAASNVTAADEARGVHRIEEIPDDEKEIALKLFGIESTVAAAAAAAAAKPVGRGWRDKYAGASVGGDDTASEGQRSSFMGEAPVRRVPASMRPAAPPVENQIEVEVEVGRTSSEGAPPEQPRSNPPAPLSARLPRGEVAAQFPESNRTSDAGTAAETRTVSAGLTQTAPRAALPFQPAPVPAPLPAPALASVPVAVPFGAVPFATALPRPEDPIKDFEKPPLGWKIPVGIGVAVLVIVALYLAWSSEVPPPPTPLLPAVIETTVPTPTAAPTPPPTAAPPVAATPTATATATATVTAKPPTKKPSSSSTKPAGNKSDPLFGGHL